MSNPEEQQQTRNNNDDDNDQQQQDLLYRQAYPQIDQFIPSVPPSSKSNKNKTNTSPNEDEDEEQLLLASNFLPQHSRRGHVNFYTILGVSPNDSDADIRRAFRHLSVMFHPDRTVNLSREVAEAMSARFKLINEAYQVLSDPIKRAAYDCLGKKGVKELGQLIPAALKEDDGEDGVYGRANLLAQYLRKHPEAAATLLKTAHEEKNLLRTAKRLGNTSELEVQFNGSPLIVQVNQIMSDIVELGGMWLAKDQEKIQWSLQWDDPERKERIEKDVEVVREIVKRRMHHDKMMKELEAAAQEEEQRVSKEKQQKQSDEQAQQGQKSSSSHNETQQQPVFYAANPPASSSSSKNTNENSTTTTPSTSSTDKIDNKEQQQKQNKSPSSTTADATPKTNTKTNNNTEATSSSSLPKPPPEPTSMKVSLTGPDAVIVNYKGQEVLALVPMQKEQQQQVVESVKQYQSSVKEYQTKRKEYDHLVEQKKKEQLQKQKEEKLKKLNETEAQLKSFLKQIQDRNDPNDKDLKLTPEEKKELERLEKIVGEFNKMPPHQNGTDSDHDEENTDPESHIDPNTGLVHGLKIPKDFKNFDKELDRSKSTRRFNRPPLWELCSAAGKVWLFALRRAGTSSLIPLSMQGHYSWQLPMGQKTASLFSVSAARKQNGESIFDASIDAEVRSSPLMTWLWSFGLAGHTGGTRFSAGFQRILSKVWTTKLRISVWQAGMKHWIPEIFIQFQRKLTETLTIIPHLRLPSPFMFLESLENAADAGKLKQELGFVGKGANNDDDDDEESAKKWGTVGVQLNGTHGGVGLILSKGTAQLHYALERPFILFPMILNPFKKQNNKKKENIDDDEDNEEEEDELDNQQSAIPFLRKWTTTIEKSIRFHLGIGSVLRHEDVLWFSKPYDALPSEKNIEKTTGVSDLTGASSGAANRNVDDDVTSSDDDDDVIAAQARRRRRKFVHGYRNQRAKDEIKTVADGVLSHGFGIGITTTVPIFYIFFPRMWPPNRGINTTISLHYKKAENKISLPIRVSFTQDLLPALVLSVAPYLLNYLVSTQVAKWNVENCKKLSLERRIRGDGRVRKAREHALLEQEGMRATAHRIMMEESKKKFNDSKIMNGGLVIVNAEYGVLKPKLKYPVENNNISDQQQQQQDDEERQVVISPVSCDVTIAIQNLVRDSKIHIAGGVSKSILAGVYDPQPWVFSGSVDDDGDDSQNEKSFETKQLRVTYRFRNRLHEVVIDDKEELRMPLVEHLVRV